MSEEPLYTVRRHTLANGRGWGKYHLVVIKKKGAYKRVTICGVKMRPGIGTRLTRSLESALQDLKGRVRNYVGATCQNCIKRAQKLRNPLDRMAEIE